MAVEDRGLKIAILNHQLSILDLLSSILDLFRCSDLANEFIPEAVDGKKVLRLTRVGFKFLAQ
jgi:hypothetical protein